MSMESQLKISIIRVITLDEREEIEKHGKIIEKFLDNWKVRTISRCIPNQPEGIHDENSKSKAIPKVKRIAGKLEGRSDAIIVSCAEDPGVAELKKALSIPVIGAGEAGATFSLTYPGKIGVLGITEYAPKKVKDILSDKFLTNLCPENVSSTKDLDSEIGKRSTIEKACELKDKGASTIFLACTGMSTIALKRILMKEVGVDIIDPLESAAILALFRIMNRRCL